ncbi:MAG: PorT family protein, partial [Tannerella sp.]|nr:PorT family protein [Tannerella sp.]
MKRTVLMVLVSVFAWQMNAQINEPGRFYITPKVGYNMSNITLFDKYGADPRHGINVGISGEYAVNERISIEPGVFYSMQGST